jgi:WD40 repeat protein
MRFGHRVDETIGLERRPKIDRQLRSRPTLGRVPWLSVMLSIAGVLAFVTVASRNPDPNAEAEDLARDEAVISDAPIEQLAIASDGRTGALASRDGTVKIWDVATLQTHGAAVLGLSGFSSVAFGPDGYTFVAGELSGTVVVADARTGKTAARLTGHAESVRAVAFSPSGGCVVSGGDDHTIRVWDRRQGRARFVLREHTASVTGLAFATDGRTFASVGLDGRTCLWDAESGRVLARLDDEAGPLGSVAFSPDGRYLALGGTGRVTIRSLSDDRSYRITCDPGRVRALRYLPDRGLAAVTGAARSLVVWDLLRGEIHLRSRFGGRHGSFMALAIPPAGDAIVTGDANGALRQWSVPPAHS